MGSASEDSDDDAEVGDGRESQITHAGESLQSNASDEGTRHFMLVFFDVLYLDGESLLDLSYGERRLKLVNLIRPIQGYVCIFHLLPYAAQTLIFMMQSCLASRTPIDLTIGDPLRAVQHCLISAIGHYEGVI